MRAGAAAPGFEASAPRSRPRTAQFGDEVAAGTKGRKRPGCRDITGAMGMKLFTGWVLSVGLVFAGTAANAQVLAPYSLASDIDGPYAGLGGRYAAVAQEAPGPAYGPRLLPALEVYTIVRESGFSPLGIPQQRGLVYTISVIDRGGDDGRLVIDARSGRIIRFMPASQMGDNFNDALTTTYGPVGPLPPVNFRSGPPPLDNARAVPRPPRAIPKVASRTPSAAPPHAGEAR